MRYANYSLIKSGIQYAVTCLFSILLLPQFAFAQNSDCGTVTNLVDYKKSLEEMEQHGPFSPPSAPAVIPVIFYVAMKDDGTSNYGELTEAEADDILDIMSQEFSSNSNYAFIFERCGRINYVNNTSIYNGSPYLPEKAHSPWAVNVYVDNSGFLPFAEFPWTPGPGNNNVYMRRKGYELAFSTNGHSFIHEMGHSFGLHHTHWPEEYPYQVPQDPNITDQPDHPMHPTTGPGWPRELVIREFQPINSPLDYKTPNHGGVPVNGSNAPKGGDKLKGTPAGCNPLNLAYWPGCSFNVDICEYNGTYLDYNGMPIDDPNNILVKNFMSYGNSQCRSEFTDEQLGLAYGYYDLVRQGQYKPDWCGNLDDKVEYEGTDTGIDRVTMEFTQGTGGLNNLLTKTLTNSDGEFNGILQPNPLGTISIEAAEVRKLGSNPDLSYS